MYWVRSLWMAGMVSSFDVSSRGGVPDLEFDGVSGVLPRSDSFNDKGFIFCEPLWRSAKLHIVSSSGKEVIRHSFL